MEVKEDLDSIFYIMTNNLMSSSQCVTRAVPMLCLFTFPYCDPAYMPGDVVYQPLCQWDCEVMRDFVCPQEWEQMIQLGELLDFKRITTFDCNLLEPSNGGDTPLCISTLDGGRCVIIRVEFIHLLVTISLFSVVIIIITLL